jgi:hypothetical protein
VLLSRLRPPIRESELHARIAIRSLQESGHDGCGARLVGVPVQALVEGGVELAPA